MARNKGSRVTPILNCLAETVGWSWNHYRKKSIRSLRTAIAIYVIIWHDCKWTIYQGMTIEKTKENQIYPSVACYCACALRVCTKAHVTQASTSFWGGKTVKIQLSAFSSITVTLKLIALSRFYFSGSCRDSIETQRYMASFRNCSCKRRKANMDTQCGSLLHHRWHLLCHCRHSWINSVGLGVSKRWIPLSEAMMLWWLKSELRLESKGLTPLCGVFTFIERLRLGE